MAARRDRQAILGSLLVCAAKAGGFVADYRASYRKQAAEDGCNRMVGRSKNIKSRLNQPERRTRMARIEQVERDKLTARQQALYDDIMRTRPRGKLSGPFSVWIHRPDIAEPANAIANCFRVSPKLDKRLIELIVLLVCRDATAQYAWSAHFNLAREAGLTSETIEAIRARHRPEFGRD